MKLKDIVIFNVKYYREKANLSQEELSKMIGKKEYFINNLENGKYSRALNLMTIDKISKALKVPTVKFMEKQSCMNDSDTE